MGVAVRLGKTATVEDAKGYDKVIVATGGTPNHTELPTTSDAIPVYTSRQVLSGEIMAGKNVVVIGGSYIGCFTAQYLAREGAMSPDELFFSMTHNSDTMEAYSQSSEPSGPAAWCCWKRARKSVWALNPEPAGPYWANWGGWG